VQELGRLCRYPGTVTEEEEASCKLSLAMSTNADSPQHSALNNEHLQEALAFASSCSDHPDWEAVRLAALSKCKQAEDLASYAMWMSQNIGRQYGGYMQKLSSMVTELKQVCRCKSCLSLLL